MALPATLVIIFVGAWSVAMYDAITYMYIAITQAGLLTSACEL